MTGTGSGTVVTAALSKRFGTRVALDAVTVAIRPGVTAFVGPNGAGKSTLLKILATVLAPGAGTVRVLGLDPSVPEERIEIRRRLGYLPQDPAMYGGFSAFDMVDYVAVLKEHADRARRHDEVRRVLDLLGVTDHMHRRLRRLSGGMRRRVALATALLGEPELLLLDEPTAGLDPEHRLRFREAISAVARRHTVVISTHQTEEVAAMCDHAIVLRDGHVRFAGTPAALAGLAEGRVWLDDHPNPGAWRAWRSADGIYRHVGEPPAGATRSEPTIEDGYLVLVDERDAARR